MVLSFRGPLREAAMLVIAAIILGFAYTGFTKRALFAPPPQVAGHSTSAHENASPWVAYEEARRLMDSRAALFIDARTEAEFRFGHIEGAVNIPFDEFESKRDMLASISRDTLIVTYCSGVGCDVASMLASRLRDDGFRNVKTYIGGWNEWSAHQ